MARLGALKQVSIFPVLLIGHCARMEEGFPLVVFSVLCESSRALCWLRRSLIILTTIMSLLQEVITFLLEGRLSILDLVFNGLLPTHLQQGCA